MSLHVDAANASARLRRRKFVARSAARRKPKPIKPAAPPTSIVTEYTRRLRGLSAAMDAVIKRVLVRHGLIPESMAMRSRADDLRLDAPEGDAPAKGLSAALAEAQRLLRRITGARSLTAGVDQLANRVAAHSWREWRSQVSTALGIDPTNDVDLAPLLDGFRRENLDLITSLAADKVERVRGVLSEYGGARVETLAARMQEATGATASRAELIARDQVLKFNAQVSQAQHEAAGITKYQWATSQDERVRSSHAALEGQVFEYASPPIVDAKTGRRANPGEDFQCRCSGIPMIPGFDDIAPDSSIGAAAPEPSAEPVAEPEPERPARRERARMLAEAKAQREAEAEAKDRAKAAETAKLEKRVAELKRKIAETEARTKAIDRKLAAEDRARDRTSPPRPRRRAA